MSESDARERLKQDRLLRREAGEGWHPDGLNEKLLAKLVLREQIIDAMNAKDPHEDEAILKEEFEFQVERIHELKEEHGIGQPPPPIAEA